MSSRQSIPIDQAERIRSHLERLVQEDAPPPGQTARAVIEANRDLIRQLRERGYSWEAVAAALRQEGLNLSANTVRQYVSVRSSERPADGQGAPVPDGSTTKPERWAIDDTLKLINEGASRDQVRQFLEVRGHPELPESVLRALLKEVYGESQHSVEYWLEPL